MTRWVKKWMDEDERSARIIVASLTAPKFKGQAALIKLVRSRWNDQALRNHALRVLEMSAAERARAVRRGRLPLTILGILSHGDLEEVAERRNKRSQTRMIPVEYDYPWWPGDPGHYVRERAIKVAFKKALDQAGFDPRPREPSIVIVDPGHEDVMESGGRPFGVHRWQVRSTRVHWKISRAFLRGKRWDGKYLWVAPDLRVSRGAVFYWGAVPDYFELEVERLYPGASR